MEIKNVTPFEQMAVVVVHGCLCSYSHGAGEPFATNISSLMRDWIVDGLRCYMERPNITPKELHAHWMVNMAELGWKSGPAIDPEAKTHPNIKPWEEMDKVDQGKDAAFLRAVRVALLAVGQLGLQPPTVQRYAA